MNLYLIGMMGSGKSVTGRKLASLLGYSFFDLDEGIQEKAQQSIADIFAQQGEIFFREKESEILNEVSAVSQRVVATGGGTVLKPENVRRMHETGKIVYLETSLETLWQRIRGREERPLLKTPNPKETLAKFFEARRGIYEKEADLKVNTDGQIAEAVAEKIFVLLEKKS